MEEYTIDDKVFEKYISHSQLEVIVKSLADKINKDYTDKEVIFVVVLNGAFMFAADLFKKINLKAKITFVKLASYENSSSTGVVKQLIGLNENIKDKEVIIVEDIVDTGASMRMLRNQLLALEPKSLEIAALMFKPNKFKENYPVKYVGMNIEDPFIIGYGFDLNGYGRNLEDIYQLKTE
ncbi:MAG: hypoxanthine phosphoribosyltransferase [Bacteroidales bacterium]|nr:hypoxanthine phosphoribosyltransferase [Bacteroidales bacterium]